MSAAPAPSEAIVVFDAECVLCSANAQLILRTDKQRRFRLASMQTAAGRALLSSHNVDPNDPDTIIVVTGSTVLRDSDAVLYIYSNLSWPLRAAAVARAVPRAVRDPVYRWVARNRYRLFGKRETCWVPEPGDRDRML